MTENGRNNGPDWTKSQIHKAQLRRLFAQVVASSVVNLNAFNGCIVLSFTSLALANIYNEGGLSNPDEPLNLTKEQASWFAGIPMICQPIGSIACGIIMPIIGRKKTLLLLNIPFFIGWVMIYFANSVYVLYAAAVIRGLSLGWMDPPLVTYVGEISEPKYRGTMTAYAQLCFRLGGVFMFIAGALVSWRTVAAVCAVLPLIAVCALTAVPDTPIFLISKGRIDLAQDSLCWIRGWTKPEMIKDELNYWIEYHKISIKKMVPKASAVDSQQDSATEAKMSLKEQIVYFFRPEMRKPLFFIISTFFLGFASGYDTLFFYLNHVFQALRIEMDYNNAMVLVTITGFLGNIVCCSLVGYSGKKVLATYPLLVCALCTIGLTLIFYSIIPSSWGVPIFMLFNFLNCLGIPNLSWMLQSELYPFQNKCIAVGIASASYYVFGFIAAKIFFVLEDFVQLSGMFIIFTFFNIFGAIYLALCLPKSDGKKFDEIEEQFEH